MAVTLVPHASGALWLPEIRTALIADAHLGYGWAQRRRGELGPVNDDRSGPKLRALMGEFKPAEVVFLGDLVHAPRPSAEERALVERILGEVRESARITAVRGNHDRALPVDYAGLGVVQVPEWRGAEVVGIHGDRPYAPAPGEVVVFGHLHPALRIEDDAGVGRRFPVFLISGDLVVLPAFSPFAAGTDLTRFQSREFETLTAGRQFQAVAATGKRAVPLGPLSAILRRGWGRTG